MIESFLELVLGNVFEVSILLLLGLFLGYLLSHLYWTRQVRKRKRQIRTRETRIKNLETSLEKKDAEIKVMHVREQASLKKQQIEVESLKTQLEDNEILMNEQGNEVESLKTQLKNKEFLIESKKNEVENLNTQLKNKEFLIESKKNEVENINTQLKKNEILMNEQGNEVKSLKTQLKNKEFLIEAKKNEVENLNTQLGQREEDIRNLTHQISIKDESISFLKKEVTDLKIKNRESMNLAANAANSAADLEESLKEMTQEFSSQKARMRTMQDDLTYIVGIGPKVSTILRSSGINSFAKLGSSDVDRIREILETKNPNILRLINPSTWPEQARMASEENWEALSSLQEKLKEGRK